MISLLLRIRQNANSHQNSQMAFDNWLDRISINSPKSRQELQKIQKKDKKELRSLSG